MSAAILYLLLGLFVVAALWAVLTPTLLRGAIALALASALLTVVMFQMDAPLAGVFELSVCAGLITVVFVSTISLTQPKGEAAALARADLRRRAFLPLLGVVGWVALLLFTAGYTLDAQAPVATSQIGVREALWNVRRLDLVGQLLVIFVGVFGVVILFKEERRKTTLEEARDQIRAVTGAAPALPQGEPEKKEAA